MSIFFSLCEAAPDLFPICSASASTSSAAAVEVNQAASAPNCFLVGSQTLPKEVSDGLAALSGVTCGSAVRPSSFSEPREPADPTCFDQNAFGKIPDVKSGSVSFSSIDLSKSSKSALGFALDTFKIDPATAKLSDLDDSLKVYLAVEAGLRVGPPSRTRRHRAMLTRVLQSLGGNSADLTNIKDVKFFLQVRSVFVLGSESKRAQPDSPFYSSSRPGSTLPKASKSEPLVRSPTSSERFRTTP